MLISNNSRRRMDNRTESVYSLYPEQEEGEIMERRLVADLPAEMQTHRFLRWMCFQFECCHECQDFGKHNNLVLYDQTMQNFLDPLKLNSINRKGFFKKKVWNFQHFPKCNLAKKIFFHIEKGQNDSRSESH